MNVREITYKALCDTFEKGKFSNIESDNIIKGYSLSDFDKNFFFALYYGVIEKKITLDYIISQFSSIPRNEIEEDVLTLLEMGTYQIIYMDKIPDSAAVNESVNIACKFFPKVKGYINAVLRKTADEKENIPSLISFSGKKGLSLKYSYPKWLVSLFINDYGFDTAEKIMASQNISPSLTVKVNELKISRDEFLKKLSDDGVCFETGFLSKKAVIISGIKNPRMLYGFDEGLFYVQDSAPQYAMELLNPKPDDTVIDVCASPGGKSFFSAIEMKNCGKIIANDVYESRIRLIENEKKKLGINIISEKVSDASLICEDYIGIADKVICDVPCSGYGVIAKKPDIRLKNENDSILLPMLQKEILFSSSKYLKIGGRILYSTCTLSKSENENIVDSFLDENKNFKRIRPPETVFPVGGKNDGFYIDILERIK